MFITIHSVPLLLALAAGPPPAGPSLEGEWALAGEVSGPRSWAGISFRAAGYAVAAGRPAVEYEMVAEEGDTFSIVLRSTKAVQGIRCRWIVPGRKFERLDTGDIHTRQPSRRGIR
jgi:hypothetical protein